MKNKMTLLVLLLAICVSGPAAIAAPEITPDAQKLAAVLDSMHVEQLWLAGRQVDWRTGEPNPNGKVFTNAALHTHCSAFAAAAAEKLGIYLLRPPEHSANLLANAQQTWLCASGTNQGWYPVKSPLMARQLANEGQLVVVTCKNPDPTRPGHIAIVRPSVWSDEKILADGPEIIQAGGHNHTSTTTKQGFKNHPGAFEKGELLYFAHPVSMSKVAGQKVASNKPAHEELSQPASSDAGSAK